MRVSCDLTKFEETIAVLEKIYEHKKRHSTFKSVELYHELLAKHFREIKESTEEGKPWIAGTLVGIPHEIFVAMDLPFGIEDVLSGAMAVLLGLHDEFYTAAAAVGIRQEGCSSQKMSIGAAAKGWLPRPAGVVYSDLGLCANVGGVGAVVAHLYNVPSFFLASPYYWEREAVVQHKKKELEGLVAFLEKLTGRKFDYNRLCEVMAISRRQVELIREINQLRTAIPCPLSTRVSNQVHWMIWMCAGKEEGVRYFEALRDELKAMVAAKKGIAPQERFRLLVLFTFPQNQMKFADWAEREMGAVFFEPAHWRWRDWVPDFDNPLESVARKLYYEPYYRFYSSLEECLRMAEEEIIQAKIDAAVNFFHDTCDWGAGYSKTLKDRIAEKFNMPTLNFPVDMVDPSPTLGLALKERLTEFLQIVTPSSARQAS